MESPHHNYGIVYVLSNECMPGLVKIGKTSREKLEMRMRELFTTGVPLPFKCEYACRVKISHMADLEKALHTAFAPNRVNENREFFRISSSQVLPLLKLMTHMNEGDATAEVEAEIENDLNENDKAAIAKSRSRRPPIDFYEMGLKDGDVLDFCGEPPCAIQVCSAKKISFKGSEFSLTALTKDLLHKDYAVQPTRYWSYKGENLMEIYDRTYPIAED